MQDKTHTHSTSIKPSTIQNRMKLTPTLFGSLLLAIVIAIGLTLSGCESDPLLAPQVGGDEGGSYGNAKLPAREAGNAQKAVNAKQNAKVGDNRGKRINPKLF